MKKLFIGVGILMIIFSLSFNCYAKKKKVYWIDGGREVLAFVGDPGSLDAEPFKFKIANKQQIKIMHKKSGWGLYAFHLNGLVVKDESGNNKILELQGFFIVKKSWLRTTSYKVKKSLKYKTIRGQL